MDFFQTILLCGAKKEKEKRVPELGGRELKRFTTSWPLHTSVVFYWFKSSAKPVQTQFKTSSKPVQNKFETSLTSFLKCLLRGLVFVKRSFTYLVQECPRETFPVDMHTHMYY